MAAGKAWTVTEGGDPIVACAVHGGSEVRAEALRHMAIRRRQRFVEEDPYTDQLTAVAGTTVVVHRSRFEVDLNRARDRAVYRTPADAWGLTVWRAPLPAAVGERSRRLHDRFYAELAGVLARAGAGGRPFVVLDLHSYNHRRGGPGAPPADPDFNPEINIGTGSLDRERWGSLVDRFAADLRTVAVAGRPLDVRENVRFRGGHLSRWVHATFPGQGCCLAVEVKKFFMDEYTGEIDEPVWAGVRAALAAAMPGLRHELAAVDGLRVVPRLRPRRRAAGAA
ncbi:MAG TPA: N-formylglutamate amidohydrolase [Acidimicrobiia bacterium]|nr:N-formylglutamate amidohydrolase [Acidimicrobiia bacterium]